MASHVAGLFSVTIRSGAGCVVGRNMEEGQLAARSWENLLGLLSRCAGQSAEGRRQSVGPLATSTCRERRSGSSAGTALFANADIVCPSNPLARHSRNIPAPAGYFGSEGEHINSSERKPAWINLRVALARVLSGVPCGTGVAA